MARGRHPTWHKGNNGFGADGDGSGRKRFPSRGFIISLGAILILTTFLVAARVISVQPPSGGAPVQDQAPPPNESPGPIELTAVPPEATPDPTPRRTPIRRFTGTLPRTEDPVDEAQPEVQITATAVEPEPSSSIVQAPRTVASSWSAGPTPVPPAPGAMVASDAAGLAAQANEDYGARIVMEGQDWGDSDEAQVANVQAVISAMDRLPDTIISAVVAHAPGPLTFVSNDEGRTVDGWQPYGGNPMTYYTNSDQGPGGYHASNQVVLSVGATSMSVGHEVLHAYQFRDIGPDEYVLALLQPEMRSFMEATGWRQTATDDEVRPTVGEPWSALDSLYVYEGRPLTYSTTSGATTTITAANPVEAFAITGSIYYTRPSWMPLPDWPEYWAWFSANVG